MTEIPLLDSHTFDYRVHPENSFGRDKTAALNLEVNQIIKNSSADS